MFRISVKTLANLEPVLSAEMEALGVAEVEAGKRVVHGLADQRILYALNYQLRTGLRVLVHYADFRARHADELYRRAKGLPWSDLLRLDQTFAIDPNVRSDAFRHPHFAALRLKDAIADHFMEAYGKRPDVHAESPDVLIHLHMDQEQVNISLDSSGASLNQRGYRSAGGKAPLNEVLAAGMILLSGWNGSTPFYDPMCGSGTLSIEAAMIGAGISAQWKRERFGFERWADFDAGLWKEVREAATSGVRTPEVNVFASDADPRQLGIAKKNIAIAGLKDRILLREADFFEVEPSGQQGHLLLNPPYGERMEKEQLVHFYQQIGNAFKHRWPGFQAWVISSDIEALKHLGLRPFRRIELYNGQLRCGFFGYQLYAGKKGSGQEPSNS